MSNALAFINEAIDALTVDGMERIDAHGNVAPEDEIPIGQRSLQIECERMDRALTAKGTTHIGFIGECIGQALIACEAAKNELDGKNGR